MRGLAIVLFGLLLPASVQADHQPNHCRDFGGGRVLLIGDSHTWLPGCDAYPGWDVDARPGRGSAGGLRVLRQTLVDRHEEVVFDLGTNDVSSPELLGQKLRRLWRRIGSERELTLVTSYFRQNGLDRAVDVNRKLWAFASRHPKRVELIDWESHVEKHPRLIGPDGLHFNSRGYEKRVKMVSVAG